MSIKLTNNWIQARRRQQLLEKERLESELKFLKYQFNPHFLFNTINSIFFLIHKNPDKASASLAKFSELLRHQLYECNDMQIPLDKEIAYLENFIQLQRLRQNESVVVQSDLRLCSSGNLGIAPFVLMTFVENAFKHVSNDTDRPNWINIRLEAELQELRFSVSNSCPADRRPDIAGDPGSRGSSNSLDHGSPIPGGIGLGNVRRRLDLLYPGQYRLDIEDNHSSFEVRLHLRLSEQTINNNYAQLCYS
ncbi:sensor histidine kinase [Puia sp. P3]|uniref:sensor histidine kinase n=1 Tax=Puia sp. P3 TaxID=3423952 RepID=UPI003D66EC45